MDPRVSTVAEEPHDPSDSRYSIASLLCPSDTDRLSTSDGPNNYWANTSSDAHGIHDTSQFAGPFGVAIQSSGQPVGPAKFRDLIDGTIQTASFGELCLGINTDNAALDLLSPRPTRLKVVGPSLTST